MLQLWRLCEVRAAIYGAQIAALTSHSPHLQICLDLPAEAHGTGATLLALCNCYGAASVQTFLSDHGSLLSRYRHIDKELALQAACKV